MKGNGQFDGAEPGGEMTAHLTDTMNQKSAQLRGQGTEFGVSEAPEVGRGIDSRKQRIWVNG